MPTPEKRWEPRSGDLEAVRIGLLGGFRVSVGTRMIAEREWRLKKAASLIKLLALSPGHRLHRERVMDVLWPDLGPKAAANNLYQALHFARRKLGAAPDTTPPYLRLEDAQLTLCPDGMLWVDVQAFEEAAGTARRVREPAAYRAAVDLYAGDLLPEDRYEEWAEGRREGLRASYIALLVELAGLYEDRGEDERATVALERAVAEDPTHEEAHVRLMRLYAGGGQPFRAVVQYERLREALRREPAREPDVASQRLYKRIVSGELPAPARPATGTPDPARRSVARHNLPTARSSFVGRGREMLEVKRLLAMTGLLTLTGPGGCGKTRLALEVAGELVGLNPDGVWLVELASLTEGGLVPQAAATALGVDEQPDRPPIDTLVNHLRTSDLLLVLDNCEHLVDACAHLVETLLLSCPRLRVLATSREALGIAGEVTWLVRPLSVPDGSPSVEDLAKYESVRLFVDRTRARLPGFMLTPENALPISEVCRKLAGIPLAIELASARAAMLAVEQVVERLNDSLKLLTGGSRTADPRHQTLRATLDWSYDLLSDPERTLFDRLSVFAGGWTLEAAETVGAGSGIEEDKVLDLLGRLADKSLVVVEAGEPGAFRYAMLEPMRQYGQEKLEASGEAERVRRRHAEHHVGLAEEAERGLLGARQPAWVTLLEREQGNLRAALAWSLDDEREEGTAELGLRIATALLRYFAVSGVSEGRGWLEKGLARSDEVSAPVLAKTFSQIGGIAHWQGEYEAAVLLLEVGLALYEGLGDDSGAAVTLGYLGTAVLRGGGNGRLTELRREAEALRRRLSDRWAVAELLLFLGLSALETEGYERMVALLEESQTLYAGCEDLQGTVRCNFAIGLAALGQGDPDRAAALIEEGLRTLRELEFVDKPTIAYGLLGAAGVAAARGQAARAARLWGAAEALREILKVPLSPFDLRHYDYRGLTEAARSLLDDEAWQASWDEGRAMDPEEVVEYALGSEEPAPASTPRGAPDVLSRREREVAVLVAQGLTNRQIASELGISGRTVETHVGRTLRKLGLASRARLAAWVVESQPASEDPS